jgi:hypothetical protein
MESIGKHASTEKYVIFSKYLDRTDRTVNVFQYNMKKLPIKKLQFRVPGIFYLFCNKKIIYNVKFNDKLNIFSYVY